MIEPIRIWKTSSLLGTVQSTPDRFGPDPQITISASGF
jgi:hypothetical protein